MKRNKYVKRSMSNDTADLICITIGLLLMALVSAGITTMQMGVL